MIIVDDCSEDNSKEIIQLDGLSEKIGELIKSEESFLT